MNKSNKAAQYLKVENSLMHICEPMHVKGLLVNRLTHWISAYHPKPIESMHAFWQVLTLDTPY